MQSKKWSYYVAGLIGNLVEHYDTALFGLLAPFIAPLFFGKSDPVTALILTYGMLPLGFLTKPLGALFFGWIGDRWGRKEALSLSLIGMAVVTVGIGCLPTYEKSGTLAPLLLALAKTLQGFFAAGEVTGGAIFILEHTELSKRSLFSSLYNVSTIGGILLASGLITFLGGEGWRVLFWAGGATALFGVFLRKRAQESEEFIQNKRTVEWKKWMKEQRGLLGALIITSGFSYVTYALPLVFMNGYIPLITSISKTQAMGVNTILLVVDMLLLPLFGYLAYRLGKERVMLFGALGCLIFGVPLFMFLGPETTLIEVIGIRLTIVVFGVAFTAPYHAWTMERVPPHQRYVILSVGSALGSQLIGHSASLICLWAYKITGWNFAPGIYLMLAGLGAMGVIWYYRIKQRRAWSNGLESKN